MWNNKTPVQRSSKEEEKLIQKIVNILSGPGRVIDSLIAEQQNNFTEEVNLISREHTGFISLHGTVTASIEMQIQIMDALEEGFNGLHRCDCGVLPLFLVRKLQMIGYAESTLDRVASYLRGRTMRVRIECSKSTPEVIRKGVPQGGPGSPCTLDIPMTLYMCKE